MGASGLMLRASPGSNLGGRPEKKGGGGMTLELRGEEREGILIGGGGGTARCRDTGEEEEELMMEETDVATNEPEEPRGGIEAQAGGKDVVESKVQSV